MPPLPLIPNQPRGAVDIVPNRTDVYGGSSGSLVINGQVVSPEDEAKIRAYFGALSDEDRNRFDIGQSNIVATRQQTAQDHADQVKQAKQLLKQRQYEFDYQNGPNSLNERNFTEGNRRFDVGTGTDLLKFGATLRGPLNFVQGDAFAQGGSNGGYSPYLNSLRTGGVVPYGGGTATTGNPTPLTVNTLANAMSGTPGAPVPPGGPSPTPGTGSTDAYGRPALSPGTQNFVDAVSQTAQGGLANKPLGWWETQTGDQQNAYRSASDYLGRATDADLTYYKRSRPGQGSAVAA